MSRRNKLIWLLVGCWLGCVPVAQAGFEEGLAAYERGDYATAFKEFKPLADQGHADAQFRLGIMYQRAQGVSMDYEEAAMWTRRAANQGHAGGQYELSVLYYNGIGVPLYYVFVHMWANLAAAQGYENAEKYRDLAVEKLTPEEITYAQKLAREWKPKE